MKISDFIHMILYANYNCLFNSVAQIIMIEKECRKYLINYKNKYCHINSVCFNNKRNKLGNKLRKSTFTWLKNNLDTNVNKLNKTIRQLIERKQILIVKVIILNRKKEIMLHNWNLLDWYII